MKLSPKGRALLRSLLREIRGTQSQRIELKMHLLWLFKEDVAAGGVSSRLDMRKARHKPALRP